MAAITSLSVPSPFSSSTRRLMRLAFGAMPLNVMVYPAPVERAAIARDDSRDVPAMAVMVVGTAADEILCTQHARSVVAVLQVRMIGDSAIDYCHADACAVQLFCDQAMAAFTAAAV